MKVPEYLIMQKVAARTPEARREATKAIRSWRKQQHKGDGLRLATTTLRRVMR